MRPPTTTDFTKWLDNTYRNGATSDAAKFSKYNMEGAFQAGYAFATGQLNKEKNDGQEERGSSEEPSI